MRVFRSNFGQIRTNSVAIRGEHFTMLARCTNGKRPMKHVCFLFLGMFLCFPFFEVIVDFLRFLCGRGCCVFVYVCLR